MVPTLQELGIDRLTVDERIALAQAIWDSLPVEPRLTAPQRAELERRLADHVANPTNVVAWEVVHAEALARWRS